MSRPALRSGAAAGGRGGGGRSKAGAHTTIKAPRNPSNDPVAEARRTGKAHLNRLQNLSRLPRTLLQLQFTGLTHLDLSYNHLPALPTDVCTLRSLETLNLAWNNLSTLPAGFAQLTTLRHLSLEFNQFVILPTTTLPEGLVTLNISDNKLITIPAEVCLLTNLTALNLRYNAIQSLPTELAMCTSLVDLELTGNPLREPPSEVVFGGTRAILAHLGKRMLAEASPQPVAAQPAPQRSQGTPPRPPRPSSRASSGGGSPARGSNNLRSRETPTPEPLPAISTSRSQTDLASLMFRLSRAESPVEEATVPITRSLPARPSAQAQTEAGSQTAAGSQSATGSQSLRERPRSQVYSWSPQAARVGRGQGPQSREQQQREQQQREQQREQRGGGPARRNVPRAAAASPIPSVTPQLTDDESGSISVSNWSSAVRSSALPASTVHGTIRPRRRQQQQQQQQPSAPSRPRRQQQQQQQQQQRQEHLVAEPEQLAAEVASVRDILRRRNPNLVPLFENAVEEAQTVLECDEPDPYDYEEQEYADYLRAEPGPAPIGTGNPLSPRIPDNVQVDPNEDVPEGMECIICLSAQKRHALFPCAHVLYCDGCVKLADLRKCPLCRQRATSTARMNL